MKLATSAIELNGNMKVLRTKMSNVNKQIFKLRDKTGVVHTDQNKILDIARGFYEDLFRSTRPNTSQTTTQARPVITNVGSEELPDITIDEVLASLTEMNSNKASAKMEFRLKPSKKVDPYSNC